MAFTTDTATRFTNPYLAAVEASSTVSALTTRIQRLSTDDQLALLWFVYTEIGGAITSAAPGAARLQLAEGLLNEVRGLSHDEQLKFMRDLVRGISTPLTRSYGVLSANTKLALWYQLAQWMETGVVVPMPANYQFATEGQAALSDLKSLDRGQQITVLRSTVARMGVDPLAA